MTRQSLAAVRRGEAAIVGRDEVLARLRRAVDEAVAGRGLTVLLTGEAGIGKARFQLFDDVTSLLLAESRI